MCGQLKCLAGVQHSHSPPEQKYDLAAAHMARVPFARDRDLVWMLPFVWHKCASRLLQRPKAAHLVTRLAVAGRINVNPIVGAVSADCQEMSTVPRIQPSGQVDS